MHAPEPCPVRSNPSLTAFDSAAARGLLKNLTPDQLKRIPVLPPGSPVERDETRLDLADPEVRECVATAGTFVAENALLVPRGAVDDQIWSLLHGTPPPDRG